MTIKSDLLADATFLGAGISGGSYVDVSSYGITGTIGTGVTAITGPQGSAAIVGAGAAGDDVSITSTTGLALVSGMSWSFWLRVDSRPKVYNGVWSHGNYSHNRGWYFYVSDTNDKLNIGIHRWLMSTTWSSLVNGDWVHFAIHLPASGNPLGWVNGVATTVTTALGSRPATLNAATVSAKILDEEGSSGRELNGATSEPLIIHRAFTTSEIAWLSDSGNSLLLATAAAHPFHPLQRGSTHPLRYT
jgi:hypothetical protein